MEVLRSQFIANVAKKANYAKQMMSCHYQSILIVDVHLFFRQVACNQPAN